MVNIPVLDPQKSNISSCWNSLFLGINKSSCCSTINLILYPSNQMIVVAVVTCRQFREYSLDTVSSVCGLRGWFVKLHEVSLSLKPQSCGDFKIKAFYLSRGLSEKYPPHCNCMLMAVIFHFFVVACVFLFNSCFL